MSADPLGEVFVEILGDLNTDDFAESLSEAGEVASEELTSAVDGATDEVSEDLAAAGAEGGEALTGGIEDAAEGLDPDLSGVSAAAEAAGSDAAGELDGALDGVALDVDTSGFDAVGTAASGAADDAVAAFDGAADEINDSLADVGSGGAFDQVREKSFAVGAGLTGAAVGAESFARSQQESNAVLDRTASRLGITDESLRDLINSQVDHTWSAADAAESMEVLTQRGVDTRDELERQLPMWDTFADATGQDMPAAIEGATRGLGAFNINAKEAPEHMDTITFLATELDVDFDVFGRRMGRVAGEMQDLDMTLDDGAAALTVFRDRGMSSRDAMNEVRDAVKESEGDMGAFLDILGLTEDEWAAYQEQVAGAEGITDEFADINNDNMTLIQEMQANLENLGFRFGALGEAAGLAGAGLGAVGPAMLGLNQGIGAFQKIGPALVSGLGAIGGAFKALGATILANPIFLIAAVIIGLIAVAWHFREEIMAALGTAFDWVSDRLEGVVGWFQELPGRILEAIQGFVTVVVPWLLQHHPLAYLFRFVTGTIPRILRAIGGFVGDVVGWFVDLNAQALGVLRGLVDSVLGFFARMAAQAVAKALNLRDRVVAGFRSLKDSAVGLVSDVVDYVLGFPDRIVRGLGNIGRLLYDVGRDLIQGLLDGAGSLLSRIGRFFLDKVPGWIRGPLEKALGIGSPSKVFEGYGGDLMEGLADGVAREAASAMDEIERFANDASEAGRITPRVEPVAGGQAPVRPGAVDPATAGRGGPLQHVEQNIYTSDPGEAARQSVSRLRTHVYLDAPFQQG